MPPTTVSPLNFLDWLASKSKLRTSTALPSTLNTPPVRSVDGDVIKFFQSSQDHLYQDQNLLQEDMDTAESSVQVR